MRPEALRTGPPEALRTGPPEALRTGPPEALRTGPPDALRERTVLGRRDWAARAEAHRARARQWTGPHLDRRDRVEGHPVEDFLFEYYDLSPGRLERWHPGIDVALVDATEYAALGAYVTTDAGVAVDASRLGRRERGLRWTADLLRQTAGRAPRLHCFGMHEWAMVHRTDTPRHPGLPLRLGTDGTAQVVESHPLVCTHVDAFRFFTPAAMPLNERALTRADQLGAEQPGCLHVQMDLYRIAYRLLPFIEATVVLDAFELARDVRWVDMRASPYDLTHFDVEAIRVEEPAGKAEYVRHQKAFADRGAPLRARLLAEVESLLTRLDAA